MNNFLVNLLYVINIAGNWVLLMFVSGDALLLREVSQQRYRCI
jgi:hypothetical protein